MDNCAPADSWEGSIYPDAPGHRGVCTSVEAADAIAPNLGRLQRLVLGVIKGRGARGATADECAAALSMDRWSTQPRTSELRRKGLIVDSGQRRRNETRKNAIVWVVPQEAEPTHATDEKGGGA
jgi:hypothetical protein